MRNYLISLALLGTAAAATPAMAQYSQDYRYGNNYGQQGNGYGYNGHSRQQIQQLAYRLDRGIQRGAINGREAYTLRREVAWLYQLDRRYSRDGLSNWERVDLERRITAVAQRIRYARQNGNGWQQGNDWRNNDNYNNDRRYDRRDNDDDND